MSYSNGNCLSLFYAAYLLKFALVDAVLYLGPVVLLPPLVDGEPPAVGVHRDPRGRDHRLSLARDQRVDLRYTAPNSLINYDIIVNLIKGVNNSSVLYFMFCFWFIVLHRNPNLRYSRDLEP